MYTYIYIYIYRYVIIHTLILQHSDRPQALALARGLRGALRGHADDL